jgi:hypothetical protein
MCSEFKPQSHQKKERKKKNRRPLEIHSPEKAYELTKFFYLKLTTNNLFIKNMVSVGDKIRGGTQ